MKLNKRTVSFVIPCFNEQEIIQETLTRIHNYSGSQFKYDILVVDNGSTDNSHEIALKNGARVIDFSDGQTVAEVRNFGVGQSDSELLIFLDADVHLTSEWSVNILDALEQAYSERCILGSHCSIPDNNSLLNQYWFSAIENSSSSHVGSGHMIMSRISFEALNGFDGSLVSGEDYDICQRAVSIGGCIIERQALKVVHEGYPLTIIDFYKREKWHGEGDWTDYRSVMSSKVLLVSLAFYGLVATSLISAIFSVGLAAFCLGSALLLNIAVTILKFGYGGGVLAVGYRVLIFEIYMLARISSVSRKLW